MSLQSNRHECKAGDKIKVTINGFPKGKATAFLFDELRAKEAQRILEAPGDTSPIACDKMAHLNAKENSVTWDIERDGSWFVAIDDSDIGSATTERIPKQS
ncbi:hypothetical protein [Lacipirellula sp.]|uniref:hypothetical protein n=1 Tax=Lacipirellula sp. TaxID=2691419 RepID=UPI003D129619